MFKVIFRTIFYQFLLLFVGISIGFIANAEYIGYKSCVIEKSINNIFFPIEFTKEVEDKVKKIGASKVFIENNSPDEFEILGEVVYFNDEFYWCKFKYRDKKGNLKFDSDIVRVNWKTWEYNYNNPTVIDPIDTEEEALKEKQRLYEWHKKIKEAIEESEKKEKELLEKELNKKNNKAIL